MYKLLFRFIKEIKENPKALFFKYSYTIFAAGIFINQLIHIRSAQWKHDFWEHSAVVHELSKHFLQPNNPMIKGDVAHAFFTPYHLLVAIFSKITTLNSIQSLEWFAAFNLAFFLYTYFVFCKSFFKENHVLIATVSLFLILTFQGYNPLIWSGFYHLMGLTDILAYPSTFAISLVFITLSIIAKGHPLNPIMRYGLIMVLSAATFIIHPPTAIFLFIVIVTLNFTYNDFSIKATIVQSLILIPAIIVSFLWPYFSMIDLLLANNEDFHNSNKIFYSNILNIAWPVLFAIPILFIKRDKTANFFALSTLLLILAYVFSYLVKAYTLSRLIFCVLMFAHILMGYLVVYFYFHPKRYSKHYIIILAIGVFLSIAFNQRRLRGTINVFKAKEENFYNKYEFLRSTIKEDDVVLSDSATNWVITSFNGKVISSKHPIFGFEDIFQRRSDVSSFFKKESTDSLRKSLLNKYNIDYVLLDFTEVSLDSTTINWLHKIGQVKYAADQLELIELKK